MSEGTPISGSIMDSAPAPGRAKPDIDSMIRVNQAGEYGAAQIYRGQLAVMGDDAPDSSAIHSMAEQEQRHLEAFDRMIVQRNVRPTALQPFWKVAGYALGAGTAIMGPRAAMACTAAVETEIDLHYQEQMEQLAGADEPELLGKIAEFREEELEHKRTAIDAGAEDTPGYPLLSAAIRLGCKVAIGLSKRI